MKLFVQQYLLYAFLTCHVANELIEICYKHIIIVLQTSSTRKSAYNKWQ